MLKQQPSPLPLVDKYDRNISYLRISLTDRCNLRCIYCMPEDEDGRHTTTGVILQHADLLTYEEILRVSRLATAMGIRKIRLTGGEPLVRRGVLEFIQELKKDRGLEQLSLTTNGVLLADYAERLWQYGVRQLNISLDSLQAKKFFEITKRDLFAQVWRGICAAEELGFCIKINVVAMQGVNSDEFVNFAQLALDRNFEVRFIEFMPMGESTSWKKERFISVDDIIADIKTVAQLTPCNHAKGAGPAKMYDISSADGRTGKIGFISPLSHHFCDQCNRLRLTSEGKLRSCLLNDKELDLKSVIRTGGSDEELMAIIRKSVLTKPKGHSFDGNGPEDGEKCSGQMSRIGG
ncbi:GTP 3',8-cyclase MoaA [Desulfotalea psychrophila]|uniref:GTP 3',8-cyclase MoaA n=1 Tax=Desulfotalea psychrophila TaxID=84980 RepID=UPI0003014256|nr:GTP 3',8-cyclase MoaA [Desulfotalea psychrophila]